jgi:hypothetical protein
MSDAPLFALATRLFVHYKFKTRKTFDPSATLIDDDYAREVLASVRAIPDARLKQLADAFEEARFGGIAPRAAAPKDGDGPLDFAFE